MFASLSSEDRVEKAREILERALCRHVNAQIAARSSRKGQRHGNTAASDAALTQQTVELLFGGLKKPYLKKNSRNHTPGDR